MASPLFPHELDAHARPLAFLHGAAKCLDERLDVRKDALRPRAGDRAEHDRQRQRSVGARRSRAPHGSPSEVAAAAMAPACTCGGPRRRFVVYKLFRAACQARGALAQSTRRMDTFAGAGSRARMRRVECPAKTHPFDAHSTAGAGLWRVRGALQSAEQHRQRSHALPSDRGDSFAARKLLSCPMTNPRTCGA